MELSNRSGAWDPTLDVAWAKAFGLASSRLFDGNARHAPSTGNYSVLLDGRASSFALAISDDAGLLRRVEPLEWAWSAHVRHIAAIHPATAALTLRRWDQPTPRSFSMPKSAAEAAHVLRTIESEWRAIPGEDGVEYV